MTTMTHRPTEATCPKRIAAMLPDGSREVRPCRLEDGHDGVCKYARPTEATCPAWCQGHEGKFQAWEELTSGLGSIRSHYSPATSVGPVEVMYGSEEHDGQGMKSGRVDINVGDDGAILSPADAREVARLLVEAADRIEATR